MVHSTLPQQQRLRGSASRRRLRSCCSCAYKGPRGARNKRCLQSDRPCKQASALQAKSRQKGRPKQAASATAQEDEDAWKAAPQKLLRLRIKDVRNTLKERWLQLFWPEDGRWWPGKVLDIRCKERKVHLLYKTGGPRLPLVRLYSIARPSPGPVLPAHQNTMLHARKGAMFLDAQQTPPLPWWESPVIKRAKSRWDVQARRRLTWTSGSS